MDKFNLPRLKDMVAGCARMDPDLVDPRILVITLRAVLEEVVNSFVEHFDRQYLCDDLQSKIMLLQDKGCFPYDIARKAHRVRMIGNIGAHNRGDGVAADEAREVTRNMQEILEYYEQY